ncbi:MAG: CotH kinase family protein [Chitinophagales bacterium]
MIFYKQLLRNILKVRLFVILSLFFFNSLNAQSTILIPNGQFQIDYSKQLIVSNFNILAINSTLEEAFNKIQLDKIYTFSAPISSVEIGKSYPIKDEEGHRYQLFFTELPLIHITTNNIIVDEPRRFASFFMAESNGMIVNEHIGIEYRGASSQNYPKKSLRIEFWADSTGEETKDVRLLGMREDDDWNLQAMYNEPLRFNNVVSFDLWQQIDTLYYIKKEQKAVNGVNMKYAEVFINNEYRGVYGVGERVDRSQLKLKKFKDDEIRGELYKGSDWTDAVLMNKAPVYDNSKALWAGFEYEYPDAEEIIDWENLYNLISFVEKSSDEEFYLAYPDKMVVDNLVNYFIFLNLTYAADNTGKNLYIAKYDKNEPYFYVPWDLDGTFGLFWDGSNHNNTTGLLSNNLYNRLLKDCSENGFVEKLKSRWKFLRTQVITYENITQMFEKQMEYLSRNGIYQREELAWNKYIYPKTQYAYTTNWLKLRLNNLDSFFSQDCKGFDFKDNIPYSFILFPNPTSSLLNIQSEISDEFYIYDINGIVLKSGYISTGLNIIDVSDLKCGIYFFKPLKSNPNKFIVQ